MDCRKLLMPFDIINLGALRLAAGGEPPHSSRVALIAVSCSGCDSGDRSPLHAPGVYPIVRASMTVGARDHEPGKPLLHICHAPADDAWVRGRMVHELGIADHQYRTRADDGLGELQLQEIARAIEDCRLTVLVASSASRWDTLAQFAAGIAQHAGLESDAPRLVIIARDFAFTAAAELPLHQRALVRLDCSDDAHTLGSLAQLRAMLTLEVPVDERPACPYPGLARFTAANRDLLFGRDGDRQRLVDRVRAGHSRILVVGPSGSGKSSLIHAAVLPELTPPDHLIHVVPRGDCLADSLRQVADALEVPGLAPALDTYQAAAHDATDAQMEQARITLRALPVPDARRRVIVIDPLEEVFAEEDAEARQRLFALLGGLWSLPWCTVILCMRADFYGELMAQRCWRELEDAHYPVAPLDEPGLRAAIVEPALRSGVHVDAILVERLMREIDRDRSSVPLPLLQVALAQLWTRLRWRYLSLADYEQFVDRDQRGLAVVLGTHATAVVQQLTSPGDRVVAQRVLLDLVHLGEGRPDTRRRRSLDDLRRAHDADDQLERVVDRLIEGRLVTAADRHGDDGRAASTATREGTAGQPIRHIDLAHDTLIAGWPMLAGWIRERRDDLRTQRRLEARATTSALLTADELPEFVGWLTRAETPEGQLLEASDALHALVRRSVVARRIRRIATGAGLLASIAIAIVFGVQAQRLRDEKAKTQQSIAEAMKVADLIVFQADGLIRTAGMSPERKRLLDSARDLISKLNGMTAPTQAGLRTGMVAKLAAADTALAAGQLPQASAMYQEVLDEAKARAASDRSNTDWQRDLSVSFNKLGDIAVRAGKLDDARGFYDQELAVAKALAAKDPSNTDWQRDLSASFDRLGDVAVRAGNLDDARGFYDQVLAVAKALAAKDPSNTDWQRDLSVSFNKLGDVAVRAGKLDDARGFYEQALAVAKALAGKDPSNTDWQRDLSISFERLGDVAVTAGKLDDARSFYEQTLAVRKALAAKDPSNTDWQRDLAVSFSKLGDVAVRAGKLDDARAFYDQALAVAKALAGKDPSTTDLQRDVSVSFNKLGDVAVRAGKLDDARGFYDQALAVAKALAGKDSSNTDWQRDLSVSFEKLGGVAVRAGKLDDARGFYDQALAVAKALAAKDPSNTDWQRDFSVSFEKLGNVAVTAGKLDDARGFYDQALAVRKALAGKDPSNTDWQRNLSVSFNKLGDVAVSAGKLDDARARYDQALAVRKALAGKDPSNTDWQRDLSVSFNKLGDVAVRAGKLDDARGFYDQALAVRKANAGKDPSNAEWQLDLCKSLAKRSLVAHARTEKIQLLTEARRIYDRLAQAGAFRGDPEFAQLGPFLAQLLSRA
jgi:tetratricopeptide (TPR) repeat protein